MLFHTWPFLVFVLAFLPLYYLLLGTRFRLPLLLVASYIFYGWWNPLYLILIVYSTLVDYVCVRCMVESRRKKLWLVVSLINNLGMLGFFKYGVFVTENLNALFLTMGFDAQLLEPDVLLPVGISFYTFQSLSYTIDYYRGNIAVEHSLLRFASFVALFPQLVAGPIERASELLPQLARKPKIHLRDITDGASLFLVGLFKKVALANYLALYVDQVYAVPEKQSSVALLVATFFFAWQIYFDFSGYTDMARGIARAMGLRLMVNFRNPYLATDLGDFWGRWHISLSTWFRDYVYIPLGGNRCGAARLRINIVITMLVSGLWHGASWTFIIWGALHAAARVLSLPLERSIVYREHVPRLLKQALVFSFVCLTWIFFRAESVGEAWYILERIGTPSFEDPAVPLLAMGMLLSVWAYQLAYESFARRLLDLGTVKVALAVFMIIYLAFAPPSGDSAFIYFQF